MNWRDFLYFSSAERRALTILLLLIVGAGVCLLVYDKGEEEPVAEAHPRYIVNPDNAPPAVAIDTARAAPIPKPRPVVAQSPQPAAPASPQPRRRAALPSTPQRSFQRTEKFPAGTLVELNTADTTTLKKVPGIGSAFAARIVKYRTLLGGFYVVDQLREVYGMEEERYQSVQNWFYVDTSFIARLPVNHLSTDRMARHPYISYAQARVIEQMSRRKGRIDGWESLRLLEEFSEADRERLWAYLSFQ
jgi:hypothetical protein